MVWLQSGPRFIQGRAKRIYDEEGAVVGAIQSIGIYRDFTCHGTIWRTKPGIWDQQGCRSSFSAPLSVDRVVSPHPARVSDTVVHAGSRTGIPPGTVRNQESTEQFLAKRHDDLHHALGQLMATEDDLLKNIETLSQSQRPVTEQVPGIRLILMNSQDA